MRLITALHDAWCALTGKCPVPPPDIGDIPDDDHLRWLKDVEREAHRSVQQRGSQEKYQVNRLEQLLIQSQVKKQHDGTATR